MITSNQSIDHKDAYLFGATGTWKNSGLPRSSYSFCLCFHIPYRGYLGMTFLYDSGCEESTGFNLHRPHSVLVTGWIRRYGCLCCFGELSGKTFPDKAVSQRNLFVTFAKNFHSSS